MGQGFGAHDRIGSRVVVEAGGGHCPLLEQGGEYKVYGENSREERWVGIGLVDCRGFQTVLAHRAQAAADHHIESIFAYFADLGAATVRGLHGTSDLIAMNNQVGAGQQHQVEVSLTLRKSGSCWVAALCVTSGAR